MAESRDGLTGPALAAAYALQVAVEQDALFWTSHQGSLHHRQTRDQAVARAHAAGMSTEQIAHGLRVRESDVERMVASVRADA